MKKLILSTTSSNEHWNGDCDYAVVQVDNVLANKVWIRQRLFEKIKLADSNLYKMYFWDWDPAFFSPDIDKLDLGFTDEFEKRLNDAGNGDIWTMPEAFEFPKEAFVKVECTQMIVREDGVAWVTIPKHSSVYVTTVEVPYNMLKEV